MKKFILVISVLSFSLSVSYAQQTQQATITAQVQMVYPHQNAVSVPLSDSIVVQFAVPVNPATLTDSTFVVQGEISGWHQGQVTYDQTTNTITLHPVKPLAVGERATACATTKIMWDSAGQMVHTRGFAWAFFAKVPTKTYGTVDTNPILLLPQPISNASAGEYGCVGDFDNDNNLDIQISTNIGGYVMYGDGNMQFSPVSIPVGIYDASDYLLRGQKDFQEVSFGEYFLNNGNRSFTLASTRYMHIGFTPVCFDLDNDGENDFVGGVGGNIDAYFMHDSIPTLGYERPANGENFGTSAFLDYDNDGQFDFVNVSGSGTFLYHNIGNGILDSGMQIPAIGADRIATGDFDEDGWADILVVREGILELCRNNHDGTFAFDTIYPVGHPNYAYGSYALTVCDINGDGHLDAIFSWEHHDADTMHLIIALGDGHGNFTLAQDWKGVGSDQLCQLNYADLRNKGTLDIIFSRHDVGQIFLLPNDTLIKPVAVTEPPVVASGYSLQQSYPNPTSQLMSISYVLPSSGNINLSIYNEAGQLMTTLINGFVGIGNYTTQYDASSLLNGSYFIRLLAGGNTLTQSFTVIH